MRISEKKEVTETRIKEVPVGMICDCCGQPILPVEKRGDINVYNFFYVCTSHNDWGNDSVDSKESFDACSPECATKMAGAYLKKIYPKWNTCQIEISHARSIDEGTDRNYKKSIKGMEEGC